MIVKIHKTKNRDLVAVCDNNILGKKFEENGLQLDLTSDFYNGDEKTEEDVLKIIKSAYIISFVGKDSVKFAIKNNLINEDCVLVVRSVPHAQCIIER